MTKSMDKLSSYKELEEKEINNIKNYIAQDDDESDLFKEYEDPNIIKNLMKPNTIYLKENGVTKEIPLVLTGKIHEGLETGDYNPKNYESEFLMCAFGYNPELNKQLESLFSTLPNSDLYRNYIFVNSLIKLGDEYYYNWETDPNTKKFVGYLFECYKRSTLYSKNNYDNLLFRYNRGKKEPADFGAIFVKTAIINNCKYIFNSISFDLQKKLMSIVNYLNDDDDLIEMISAYAEIPVPKYITKDMSIVQNAAFRDVINLHHLDDKTVKANHLCSICTLPQACEKIHPKYKECISKYDDITDGIQLSDDEGLSDKFVVTKCKKYCTADKRITKK